MLHRTRIASAGVLSLLGCLGLVCSCSDPEPVGPPLPAMSGQRTLLSLLQVKERETLEELPAHPVRVSPLTPNPLAKSDSGVLPALEMFPSAAVRLQVPATQAGATLHLAAGVDDAAYKSAGQGRAHFLAELDGREVFRATIPYSSKVPAQQRTWNRAHIPCDKGGALVLRTRFEGQGEPPRMGFGLLDIEIPLGIQRTRASAEHPNVLVVMVDTLRADALSTYGSTRATSPVLDSLAARGTVFERALSAAPWTWPAVASVFTGLGPVEHGVTDLESCYLAEKLLTLSEALQLAGYTTGAIATNPLIAATRNFDQGFETFEEHEWANAAQVVDSASAWLDSYGQYRFYLYLHLTDPHLPYEPPAAQRAEFAADVPANYSYDELNGLWKKHEAGQPIDWNRLETLTKNARSLYDAEVASVDTEFGRLLEHLRSLGQLEQTVIVFTADHGEEFLEHQMLGHGKQFHDESLRVPLVLAGPGVPRARRERAAVETRSLAPTLLHLAGVEPHANLDQLGLFQAEYASEHGSKPIFFSTELGRWPAQGARTMHGAELGLQRLTWAPAVDDGPDLFTLFDLDADPEAHLDLALQKPAEVEQLRQAIATWLERGAAIRPQSVGADQSTEDLLKGIGYIGDE